LEKRKSICEINNSRVSLQGIPGVFKISQTVKERKQEVIFYPHQNGDCKKKKKKYLEYVH
jgi:hypothetical protein